MIAAVSERVVSYVEGRRGSIATGEVGPGRVVVSAQAFVLCARARHLL